VPARRRRQCTAREPRRHAATAARRSAAGRARGRADRQRHAAIRQRLAQGDSVRAISLELGLARNTVRRFTRAGDPEELLVHDGTGRRPSILEPYRPYLHERWNAGCADATALWQEIRARGYSGGYSLVRDYLAPLRGTTAIPAPPPAPPKARKAASWILTRPGNLARDDRPASTRSWPAARNWPPYPRTCRTLPA
jgi:hypothetical protein